jgi:ribonuclease HI
MEKFIVHTDGGSRGNPGPSGIGIVINDKEYSEYVGEGTNNVAEYKAVIFALQKSKSLLSARKLSLQTPIEIYLDSELVCNQLSGEFKIKEESL